MRELYAFKQQDAFDFANYIGAKTFVKGDELFFKECCYCHGRGKANEKSFSINLRTGQFKCFRESCGMTGNMVILAKDFDFSLGMQVDEYYKPRKQYRTFPKPKEPIKPKPEAIQYLESRGISERVANEYQITVQNEHPNILVFPFLDGQGNLVSVKYRKTDYDKAKDNNKEWFEKNTKPILFGMYQCDINRLNRVMILTEGQIDSLSVAEAGIPNAVSVPTGAKGFTWIPYCWDWIHKNFSAIIVFGDYEKGHMSLLDDIKLRFKTLKIKHVRHEDYKDCKDANEILQKYGKEQIKACIDNAELVPVSDVVNLADVEDVDIFKLEKLKTGISQLDRLLYGGLPFGGVHLITGKAGHGKSTLASQIVVNAREQGYKCFCYSGELPNYLFKAWMSFQVAGQHCFEYQNEWGDRNYNISATNKQIISDWYRDYIWLYDASMLDDVEHVGLVKTAEKMILQYGCKVILLDNLMTALDLEDVSGYDKYDKQSMFVKKLAQLARQYNVLILLVAHKRKNNFSANINDEVAGSSDVTNLGMITLSYEKGDDMDADSRLLKISKNRLFGKTNTAGWELFYDERSKRIFGQGDNVKQDFSCFKHADADGFEEIDVNLDNPFW